MKRSIYALGTMATWSLMVGGAQAQAPIPPPTAQACPANPLTLLSGTYTFKVEGVDPYVYGIVGTFLAVPTQVRLGDNLSPIGRIQSITASSIIGNGPNSGRPTIPPGDRAFDRTPVSFTRLETEPNAASIYQINVGRDKYTGVDGLCPGGSLTLNLSSRPMQYDFYFVPGSPIGEIYLVSTIEGRQATGRAARSPDMTAGCPAANPILGYSAFEAHGIDHQPIQYPNYTIAGMWSAWPGYPANSRLPQPDLTALPAGTLDITATSNLGPSGSVTRVEADFGKYQTPLFSLFPNQGRTACSGTLTFNLSSFPVQFDYWWYGAGFNNMYFISTNALPIMGEANKLTGPLF